MTTHAGNGSDSINPITSELEQLKHTLNSILIGQQEVVLQTIIALVAGGHVLIEGVPGLGKTLLVRALAKTFKGHHSRIQFTPDLMPSDVTGHSLYHMASQQFTVRKGPAFTHLLLADEINRAPAKTQAALLEVMQEQQITIDGSSFPVPTPFMVLATQNPIEQEGTYPLPEAELDRFTMKLLIDFPSSTDEQSLVQQVTQADLANQDYLARVDAFVNPERVKQWQQAAWQIQTDTEVIDYAVRICRATRAWSDIARGAGPRGSINLVLVARAHALLAGRDFVTPDDIKALTLPVLRHRILLTADREIEGSSTDQVLLQLLEQIEAPRQ